MNSEAPLKRTPLYEEHLKLGGKMVPFAGWEMPVKYIGLIEEHLCVRKSAGLFDVSHMGEIFVSGKEAELALSYLCCNDVTKLEPGRAQYSAITNSKGGIVDDVIIYRFNKNEFDKAEYLVCVNASNVEKVEDWFSKNNKFDAEFKNRSDEFGQIAIQGPEAISIFEKFSGIVVRDNLTPFSHRLLSICDSDVIVARTGYSGEDGLELFVPWEATLKIWQGLYECGQSSGLIACGLGARDTLRLEACYPLYGHELAEDVSAIESGIGFFVKISDRDFMGREVLKAHKEEGSPRSLIGFTVVDPGIVRDQVKLFDHNSNEIGWVTSGTKTPCFERPIGMAIVKREFAKVDAEIFADVRGKLIKCHVSKKPFYKRA